MWGKADTMKVIDEIIIREGGYVNNPSDPGGETKYGISKGAYPNENIRQLTKLRAKQIYYTDYYLSGGCDLLPDSLKGIFLDMAVHQGITGATMTLQKAINAVPGGDNIQVDGKLGPQTTSAASHLSVERLRAMRTLALAEKVFRNPKLEIFWFNWYQRASTV